MAKQFFLFCFLLSGFIGFSQKDTICMVNGITLIEKVAEINQFNVIYYKEADTLHKHQLILPKRTVGLIKYAKGGFEIISASKIHTITNNDMYLRGVRDALINYKHPCGAVGTGIASFATGGILGLIPAIACSATQPKLINLGIPRGAPVDNIDYMVGYMSKAKKMKQKRVWGGYAAGLSFLVVLLLIKNA